MARTRRPTADAPTIRASIELCSDDAFTWGKTLRAATFDHHGHVLGTDETARHLRRWRLSDGAFVDEIEAMLPFDLYGALFVAAQPLDESTVLFASNEGSIALLDARTLEEKRRVSLGQARRASVFATDGAVLVIEDNARLCVLDREHLNTCATWDLPATGARWYSPSSRGEHMIIGHFEQTLVLDAKTGQTRDALGPRRARCAKIDDGSRTIGASYDEDDRALVLRPLDADEERRIALSHRVDVVTVVGDGPAWLCASAEGAVTCVDADGAIRWTRVVDGRLVSIAFSPDGRFVAAAADRRVAIIEAESGRLVRAGGPAEPAGGLISCDSAIVAVRSYVGRSAPHLWIRGEPRASARALRGPIGGGSGRFIASYTDRIERYASAEEASVEWGSVTAPRPAPNVTSLAVAENGDVFAGVWSVSPRRKTTYAIERLAIGRDTASTLVAALPSGARWLHVAEEAGILLATLDHRELFAIDRVTGEVAYRVAGLKKPAARAVCTRDARSICATTIDGTLAFFRDRALVAMHKEVHPLGFALALDEKTLFTVRLDALFEWDVLTGACVAKASLPRYAMALCVDRADAGRSLYVSGDDSNLYRVTLGTRPVS